MRVDSLSLNNIPIPELLTYNISYFSLTYNKVVIHTLSRHLHLEQYTVSGVFPSSLRGCAIRSVVAVTLQLSHTLNLTFPIICRNMCWVITVSGSTFAALQINTLMVLLCRPSFAS